MRGTQWPVATKNLPKVFATTADKQSEITRLETMLAAWKDNPRVNEKVIRLAKARLRKARGIVVAR